MTVRPGPSERPLPWLSTELGHRVVSAVVMAALAIGAAYHGGWPSALFWLLAGVGVLCEWIAVTGVRPRLPSQILLTGALALLSLFYLLGIGFGPSLVVVASALLASFVLVRGVQGGLWLAAGFGYALVIVLAPTIARDRPDFGLVGLFWMFAVVWATDIAAYFTGRSLGGPKLWPKVSPKKTWSGFGGGLLAGIVAGCLVIGVGQSLGWSAPVPLLLIAAVSAVASVASQLGDLGESAFKRSFGVKDSSHLIPGHGGVMDRLDGFWAVAALIGLWLLAERVLAVFS